MFLIQIVFILSGHAKIAKLIADKETMPLVEKATPVETTTPALQENLVRNEEISV